MQAFIGVIFALWILGAITKAGLLPVVIIILVIIGLLIYYYRDDQVYKREHEERERKNRIMEAEKQKQAIKEQKLLEHTLQENAAIAADVAGKNKIRSYMSEMLRYTMMIPSDEGNQMPLAAINDTIDNIVSDYDIKPEHWKELSVQNDKMLIFEHLEENELSKHLVIKRLKGLFNIHDA